MSDARVESLEILSGLLQRRKDLRFMLGQAYQEAVEPYRLVIRGLAAENGHTLLKTALACAEEADRAGEQMAPSLFLAAYVEEIESQAGGGAARGEGE